MNIYGSFSCSMCAFNSIGMEQQEAGLRRQYKTKQSRAEQSTLKRDKPNKMNFIGKMKTQL